MNTGLISFSLFGIPSIFLIVFIAGIIGGDAASGFVSGLITELGGVFLLALIPEILLPAHEITTTDIFLRMLIIMAMSVGYATSYATEQIPLIIAPLIIALLVLFSPLIFGMALLFGLLGGLIGKPIYSRGSKPKAAKRREPPVSGGPPVTGGPPATGAPPAGGVPAQGVVPQAEAEPLDTEVEMSESDDTQWE